MQLTALKSLVAAIGPMDAWEAGGASRTGRGHRRGRGRDSPRQQPSPARTPRTWRMRPGCSAEGGALLHPSEPTRAGESCLQVPEAQGREFSILK